MFSLTSIFHNSNPMEGRFLLYVGKDVEMSEQKQVDDVGDMYVFPDIKYNMVMLIRTSRKIWKYHIVM